MSRAELFAQLHNRRGMRRLDRGEDPERAADSFQRAAGYAPGWTVAWFNLGLARKLQRRWAESLAASMRAAELDPSNQAAWWNAGIAASALRDWPAARRAWAGFGITLPPGEGEVELELGLTPIRLEPDTRGAVVWCRRIDPARAVICNVPPPESGYRYGDLLLHDGAPSGARSLRGQEVPVFDAIELLEPSPYLTYLADLRVGGERDILGLAALAAQRGLGLEDWETIRELCRACSAASPGGQPGQLVRMALAAASEADLRAALAAWQAAYPLSALLDLRLASPLSGATPAS